MQGTPSLPSLPDPLKPGVVAPDGVLSMRQIGLIFRQMTYNEFNSLK